MKRIFLLLTLLVMFPLLGNAQLNVKKQTSKIETIATARAGYFSLKVQDDLYFIVTNTTNQFDDPFIILLGEGKESALQTLNDLVSLCGNIEDGSTIVIQNGEMDCTISNGLMGGISFRMDSHAGYASTSKAELNKMIKALGK